MLTVVHAGQRRGTAPPYQHILELVHAYLGDARRAGRAVGHTPPSGEDAIWRDAGFTGPELARISDGRVIDRDVDDVVAEIFSLSSSAPPLFGPRLTDFENDLRQLLAHATSSGRFSVPVPDTVLKIWRPVGHD